MVSEKWNVNFDIALLQKHLRDHVLPLEATFQSPAFGGWSVLSSDGSHKDGWHPGHLLFENLDPANVRAELKKAKATAEYKVPTEICHGYLKQVIDTIQSYGLNPRRARVIQLAAGTSSVWHSDCRPDKYGVRLHVPILTNSGCFFETETEKEHLVADGSAYFIFVNREHRVINLGDTHRYHLVMDVQDRMGVSQFHRFDDFIQKQVVST